VSDWAEYIDPQFLRFDPAMLGGELTPEERVAATAVWAEAMEAEIQVLYQHRDKDTNLTSNLPRLELPNFLGALEHLVEGESPERVVDLATSLEGLIAGLNRPRVLARVVEIRTAVARRLGEWSHAQFQAADASIDRLIEQGRSAEAVQAAQASHLRSQAAGEGAYEGAAYDGAMAQFSLGRALRRSGDAQGALQHLEEARRRFERFGQERMAAVALTDKADGLRDLGRYDEAAEAYQQTITRAEKRNDPRSVATNKNQLATVRLMQKSYSEALRLYGEAREVFERLNEPVVVAGLWHQIGMVCEDTGAHEAAEEAYQKSLNIRVQTGDRAGQAATLNQLGNLYSRMDRSEDAVRLYRQAAEIYVANGDLRYEGLVRNNIANKLVNLGRFDEARVEINRAIECDRPFGHVAHPWTSFDNLSDLERAVGDRPAALIARNQAIAAYLAYRRGGGAPRIDTTRVIAMVKQDPAAARAAPANPDLNCVVAAEITLGLENLG
jgi:tetratricopeptide (TPR) repeat protein